MRKTKIDYCDMTWNPISGCFHNCPYCYAKTIAERFGGASETIHNEAVGEDLEWLTEGDGSIHELDTPIFDADRGYNAPYPYDFDPTFCRYKLDEPSKIKKPKTIFVGSMADIFGNWVPDDWIKEIFDACLRSPQHRYLFLTKNPQRYLDLARAGKLPQKDNMWYGSTSTTKDIPFFFADGYHTFLSVEPILEDFCADADVQKPPTDWIIVGTETGNRKGRVTPEKEWIEKMADKCKQWDVPLFMKGTLGAVVGEENLIQQYPW